MMDQTVIEKRFITVLSDGSNICHELLIHHTSPKGEWGGSTMNDRDLIHHETDCDETVFYHGVDPSRTRKSDRLQLWNKKFLLNETWQVIYHMKEHKKSHTRKLSKSKKSQMDGFFFEKLNLF